MCVRIQIPRNPRPLQINYWPRNRVFLIPAIGEKADDLPSDHIDALAELQFASSGLGVDEISIPNYAGLSFRQTTNEFFLRQNSSPSGAWRDCEFPPSFRAPLPRSLDGVRFPSVTPPSEPDGRVPCGLFSRGHRGLFRNDFRRLHEGDFTPSPLESEISALHVRPKNSRPRRPRL